MKKIIAFLLPALALVFASCNDDKTGPAKQWLLKPEATVLGTTVKMTCPTLFGPGALEGVPTGFTYAILDDSGDLNFVTVSGSVSVSTITATLNGLQPETRYIVSAYANLSTGRMQSEVISFETAKEDVPNPDPSQPVFGTPSAGAVTQTTATLSCGFAFTAAPDYSVYFRYRVSSASDYSTKAVTTGTGTKTVSLTGLTPGTNYEFQLCAEWAGETYASVAGTFRTESGSVTPGDTKYSGWAELPVWEKSVTDYHFVEHFCDTNDKDFAQKISRNFSACYSASMKCPVWVAAPLHDAYAKKNVERKNSYKDDPDIPSSIQVGKWSGYSRGHMLGSAERLVSRDANSQVMYFSNIGPQLTTYFNTGGGQWNTAEDWVDEQWRGLADTCYQVVGTWWNDTTKKVVSGTTIPTHYYIVLLKAKKSAGKKWVVNCTRDELQCIGIWIEHRAYSKSEVVTPGNFASKGIFMPVSEIEKKTGHTFFANVTNAPKDTYNVSDWNF